MANTVKPIYKYRGETPKQAVERFRKTSATYADLPIAYAGRLDPLAEGVLLLLIGDACKRQSQYHDLSKTYRLSVILGVATDTYDLLGRISGVDKHISDFSEKEIERVTTQLTGTLLQNYPPYSAKPVAGKPLFQWAREGLLKKIPLPSHEVTIDSIKILGIEKSPSSELITQAIADAKIVTGDFRQDEIAKEWREVSLPNVLPCIELRVSCSSGTYMRQLAQDIGQALGTCALAARIIRERVGDYDLRSTSY